MTDASGSLPIAAIILAAGAATRMGRLKQLLPFRGRTLVAHTVREAREAGFSPVIVVVGAQADEVSAAVAAPGVEIMHNDLWQTGMGSSIVAGMLRLRDNVQAVAILLADQPLITSGHLIEMTRMLQTGPGMIVAAEYSGTLGVPALFKREMFDELLSLAPEAGARHLLRRSSGQISSYPLPQAAIDIDTPEDFAALDSAT